MLYNTCNTYAEGGVFIFQIDGYSRTPIYEQLTQQLESFLLSGVLAEGDQLPSVRAVAMAHAINPRTILHAYSELEAAGLITAVPGKGYFVVPEARLLLRKRHGARAEELSSILYDMARAGVDKQTVLALVEEAYATQKQSAKGENV